MERSELLKYILAEAEKLRERTDNTFVTVDDIFSSMITYYRLLGRAISVDRFDTDESMELYSVIKNVFNFDYLFEYEELLTVKKPTDSDKALIDDVMKTSESIALRDGKKVLSADIVLEYMLTMATDRMKAVMAESKEDKKEASSEKKGESGFNSSRINELITQAEETLNNIDMQEDSLDFLDDLDYIEETVSGTKVKTIIADITREAKEHQKALSSKVLGQDNAINVFVSGYFQLRLREALQEKTQSPRATFLFAGPPGVGKTLLAKEAASIIGLPFKRFDMSEYSLQDASMQLCGTDEAYRGAHKGDLTEYVENNPDSILLFDEIEKAHIAVIHLFLQILDCGKLGDMFTKKEVDFSRTIIFFTTNAARKLYEGSETPNLSGISRKAILKALETDVDPKSGKSVFPAAICSRFATGNVALFNHMEAHILRAIAEKELKGEAEKFGNATKTKMHISDDVYSCILFAEGGNADARTTVSRARKFFSTELYELLRLVSEENNDYSIEAIENININIELPEDEKILSLFKEKSKGMALCFGDKTTFNVLNNVVEEKGYSNIIVNSVSEAEDIVKKQDIDVIFCDLRSGQFNECAPVLNVEDVESDGRTFFRYVCENADVPIYIVCDEKDKFSDAEAFSLSKEGARGIINVSETESLSSVITDILTRLHQQKSMISLAKANKLVTYETSQSITDEGKTAEIKMFDLALETCVEAEDIGSVLSAVSRPDVKFSHIIGNEEAKSELGFFVEYLKNPKMLAAKGLAVPKGVLFYGPPGTGKTMLAKAVAGEANITFINTEGNKFFSKYVGESEASVHRLFATARKYAPAIIFIDEIDAIAKERTGSESNHTAESVLTAFLSEMDGFKTDAKKPVFVLAATNFNVEPGTSKSLDEALLRRFDRHIYVDLPDKEARLKYINKKIEEKPVFKLSKEEIENIAVRSTGMSLAKLGSIFEFSLRIAIRTEKDFVDDEVFEEAFESYIYGKEKKWEADELEKTAYHEAGHAFLCWHSGEKPAYLTIVARGNHGGYMRLGDNEKRGSFTKNMLLSRIRTALGGRAAEMVFFGEAAGMTTGASGDLKTATSIAKDIVCTYGMDDELGLAVFDERDFSDSASAQLIRSSVNKILNEEMNSAKKILADNQESIKRLVEVLLQKNHLNSVEIDNIFRKYSKEKN